MVSDRAEPSQLHHMYPTVIRISPHALAVMTAESAARSGPDETGGILLGHDLGQQILITAAGGPGPNARHAPARFKRDLAHAERLADAAYEQDGSLWIGDWHTHPQGLVRPSRYDLQTYRRFLQDTELDFDRFLAVIVTQPLRPQGPALWAWSVRLRRRRWPTMPSFTAAPIAHEPDEAYRP